VTEQERLAAALEYQQAQQPAMMNPNLARQGARGRENMMPPTSIMDERYPAFKRNQEDVEKLMLGLDIVGSAIPLAGPAAKGAVALGKYAAPQIAQGLENYAFRTGMALPMVERQAGRTFAAPQDEALRLAQERAALPVERGGLGLSKNNTAEQRAAAMGAEFGWAHGSNEPNITTFKPSKTGAQGPGIYATNYLPETNMYSSLKDKGGTSYPLAVFRNEALISKLNNPYDELKVNADDELISELFKQNKSAIITTQEPTPDWLLKQGVAKYPERQHYVSINPDNFRSRFAAFDPFRRNAAIAAAMGVAAPDLLAKEKKK
jgi:hypothetical protein